MGATLTLSEINFDIPSSDEIMDATLMVGVAQSIKPIYKSMMRAIRNRRTWLNTVFTNYARFSPM